LAENREFSSHSDVFGVSLSNEAFYGIADIPPCKVVELEAFHHSKDKTFSSFLYALSSVIGKSIQLLYPDAGVFQNLKIDSGRDTSALHLLFFHEGVQSSKNYRANHFVPLIFRNSFESFVIEPSFSIENSEPPKKSSRVDSQCLIPFMPDSNFPSKKVNRILTTLNASPILKRKSSSIFNYLQKIPQTTSSSLSQTASSSISQTASSSLSQTMSSYSSLSQTESTFNFS